MAISFNSVGAGLYDGKIRTSDGNIYDIYAIVSASGSAAQDEVEVKGDDEVKATFVSNIKEELTIEANGLSFDVIQAITGNSVSSSAGGLEVALGTDSQASAPFIEVKAYTRAKDSEGNSCIIEKIWHKVQIKPPTITQEGEGEFKISMEGVAYQASVDIIGGALATKRVSTLKTVY